MLTVCTLYKRITISENSPTNCSFFHYKEANVPRRGAVAPSASPSSGPTPECKPATSDHENLVKWKRKPAKNPIESSLRTSFGRSVLKSIYLRFFSHILCSFVARSVRTAFVRNVRILWCQSWQLPTFAPQANTFPFQPLS